MDFTVLLFVLIGLMSPWAASSDISDYISWKKRDIIAWHQFFPTRALEEERQTLNSSLNAVQRLYSGLINSSLSSIVAFQSQELETAQMLMNGTAAEGCVKGISNYIADAINNEVSNYLDCSADAEGKLERLNSTWAKIRSNYLTAYQRALSGIDFCAKTYPNKDSFSRLKTCVEYVNQNYFSIANLTMASVFPSPSMTYFQQSVVVCASSAAGNITAKGWKFLGMLVECAKLSGTVDPDTYAQELYSWQGYNDTLSHQITNSQNKNYVQVLTVEVEMKTYYNLQKQAQEQYLFEARDEAYYMNQTNLLLGDYYSTINLTSLDNPGDASCAVDAKTALDGVANQGAEESLACDLEIVNKTLTLIQDITDSFLTLNTLMPSIGNVAILQCFSDGFVFAPNTIADCYDLVYSQFDVEYMEANNTIVADVKSLVNYVEIFFSGGEVPCGRTFLRKLLLGGDKALYQLQRCLYISSGTEYSVTTPHTNPYIQQTTPVFTNVAL